MRGPHTADPSEKLMQLDCIRFECAELVSVSYRLKAFGQTLVSTPEDCPALFRAAENLLLFVATGRGVPWPTVARELALALYPDEEPGRIAPGLKKFCRRKPLRPPKPSLTNLVSPLWNHHRPRPSPAPKPSANSVVKPHRSTRHPRLNQSPPTPGQTVEPMSSPGATAPNPPPGLEKPNLPEGQPTGGSGTTEGTGRKSGPSGSGPRPPAPRRGKLRSYVVKDPTPPEGETDPTKARQRSVIASAGVAKVMP